MNPTQAQALKKAPPIRKSYWVCQVFDWIDISILDSRGQYLYLQKHKIEHEMTEFDLIVDKMPAQAGIDPLNKLMDRKPDDNLTKVVASE